MSSTTPQKVLVFGATGPAGICLLRELLFRKHTVIAYIRNPSKIPEDLKSTSTNLEIIQGEMTNQEALNIAVSKSDVIISLLGPNTLRLPSNTLFPDFYRSIFTAMRKNNKTRIYAMGTLSIPDPLDHFSFIKSFLVGLVYLVANSSYQNIIGIGNVFDNEAEGIDWTVFRIAYIPGESDEESWKRDREGSVNAGYVGDGKWGIGIKRSLMAKWLGDCLDGEGRAWVGKMPAISGS